ncbi:hypothetical protein K9L16_03100 [Candidatus Pacearchaeota archaeon]|nr:hypothetical protein [Candidatus Pacearchaeota archaeon]
MNKMIEINEKDFEEYLEKLSQEGLPFECPYLKVLQEDVSFKGNTCCSHDYKIGDMLCTKSTEKGRNSALHDHYCNPVSGIFGGPKIKKEGTLEKNCRYGFKVRFKIIEVQTEE